MSDSEEDEIPVCPLCVEEMDLSDKNFLPCPCGYRVSCVVSLFSLMALFLLTNVAIGMYVVLASYQRKFKRALPSLSYAL